MRCPTCIHPEGYDRLSGPCPTCGGDGLPADPWQARHVESGAVVPCQDRAEAQAHVRESVSGRWVAERSFCPAVAPTTPAAWLVRGQARSSANTSGGDGVTTVHTPSSVRRVPNKPKTPVTGFRIPESVKAAAAARAAAEGETLTDVVVEHLTRYGKGKPKPPSKP